MTKAFYIASVEFAELAGISHQKARRALSRAFNGMTWRGQTLIVQRVRSRGGASGWQYQVRSDSLPAELQRRLTEATPTATKRILQIETPSPTAHWRYGIIEAALKCLSGSPERATAVLDASRVIRLFPTGRRGPVAKKTIRTWIADYERHGMAGLRPKARADRGGRRTYITRVWDAGVPFEPATKDQLREKLDLDIRSLWAANDTRGWQHVARLASDELIELTVHAGFDPGLQALRRLCKLPRTIVERGREYRAVAVHDKDRKKYFDLSLPRISRSRAGLQPMQIVGSDVHHLDVIIERGDGTTFTPKIVAFHDLATNRLFAYPVFPAKGTMVRQEHFVDAYIAMIEDPRWGVPQTLYIDNGGEFNIAELIDDAQQLNTKIRYLDDDADMQQEFARRRSSIVKAQPYNAPAKAIEGLFNVFERGFLSIFQGWIGGDRFRQKTKNIGHRPEAYPHDEARFRADLALAVEAYDTTPQAGSLNGKSPREAFDALVAAGWQRRPADGDELRALFAHDLPKKIKQGRFKHANRYYTAPELQRLAAGTPIIVRLPISMSAERLPVLRADGKLLCIAQPDLPFAILDPAGAREAAERRRRNADAIEAMRDEITPVNLMDREQRAAARQAPAAVPHDLAPIRISDQHKQIGRELKIPAAEHVSIEEELKRQQRAEKSRLLKELEEGQRLQPLSLKAG